MGTEVCANELINEENLSQNSISISIIPDESCGIVDAKNVIVLSQSSTSAANQGSSIRPVTPDSKREIGEQNHDLSCPSTLGSSPPNVTRFESNQSICPTSPDGHGSETPKRSVFDSFAPGPDKFMLAPHHRKYVEESRFPVVRRLNFDCVTNLVRDINHEPDIEIICEEEHLFECVYGTILDAIVAEQTEELVAKFPTRVSQPDEFRTPKFAPHLSGVAETCPGAPRKAASNYRHIDKEICRKLEF